MTLIIKRPIDALRASREELAKEAQEYKAKRDALSCSIAELEETLRGLVADREGYDRAIVEVGEQIGAFTKAIEREEAGPPKIAGMIDALRDKADVKVLDIDKPLTGLGGYAGAIAGAADTLRTEEETAAHNRALQEELHAPADAAGSIAGAGLERLFGGKPREG